MDAKLLLHVCWLLLGVHWCGGHLRVQRQIGTNPISGANVTHTTEYDESTKTLRFRVRVDYGKQPWDSGQRTFPTPDGRVVTISWTGNRQGVSVQLEQRLPALLEQSNADLANGGSTESSSSGSLSTGSTTGGYSISSTTADYSISSTTGGYGAGSTTGGSPTISELSSASSSGTNNSSASSFDNGATAAPSNITTRFTY